MSTTPFCEIFLIRHGETDLNVKKLLHGHLDEPLNETGQKQAEKLQQSLSHIVFSAAFTSDLSRASSTAAIVLRARQVEIQKTQALRERSMQQWEGKPIEDVDALLKELGNPSKGMSKEAFLYYKLPPGNIESYGEMYERLTSFILSINVTPYLGKKILLSTHGGNLRSVLCTHLFEPEKFWVVPNCSYLTLHVFADGTIKLAEIQGPHLVPSTRSPW